MRRIVGGDQLKEERVGIGLGSNLADRVAVLLHAYRSLTLCLSDCRISGVYESAAVGFTDQPDFLNACCIGRTRLTPTKLLSKLQRLERSSGRSPGGPRYGPRTLDLDLLLYGALVVEQPGLIVPHPRLRERAFVLLPFAEIAGDWEVPASRGAKAASVEELARRVDKEGVVRTSIELHPA